MEVAHHISLKPWHTFGMDVKAQQYVRISHIHQLAECSPLEGPRYILGGGSNVLPTDDIEGTVLHNALLGIQQINADDLYIWYEVASGEPWHPWVMYTLKAGLSGLENLALIPGTVGAAPIQNIGAYGVEAKDSITQVTYWDFENQQLHTLSREECQFGYRESIFKHALKDRAFITSVTFKLHRTPQLRTSYGAIGQELEKRNLLHPTPMDVAQAVMHIRQSKLPDPAKIGNAGSFFKNPTIDKATFELLRQTYSTLPGYEAGPEHMKVPAGWLIEQAGWKGYRKGDAGVHAQQALVLVNYGQATGHEIDTLANDIVADIHQKFGISLGREVQVWP